MATFSCTLTFSLKFLMIFCGRVIMFDGALIFRKLSETNAEKRRYIFEELIREYGSVESIPNEAWKSVLPNESFRVCRLNGMESSHTGKYTKNYMPGVYSCICCGVSLFDSTAKFGALGWLSFSQSIGKDKNIERISENGVNRIRCKNCLAHLGRIHADSVSETSERYTINSAAVDFNTEKFDAALRKCSMQSL